MSSEIGSSVLLRRSALTASQKLRQSRATPLKSVENQSQDKADKMGEPDKLQNGAVAESGISIKLSHLRIHILLRNNLEGR